MCGTSAKMACLPPRALHSIRYRTPVILSLEAFDFWLDCANVDAVTAAALLTAPVLFDGGPGWTDIRYVFLRNHPFGLPLPA
jgi:hypothetical protein